ncbi:hypothetical protein [Maritimibacter dapengensis]|uniref:Uncharacterized protein n=1 Tax=Maritimibacter dapengensis TaxID=2836868 RepID=A0ABS6T6L1_9RHOB|nr:hypothetical protein [Maritimibacter dapengensis]MBV7380580.1 hypothetical protein [Maritimibacter dapengensis]
MNIIVKDIDRQSAEVLTFIEEHGEGLNALYRAAFANPFIEPSKSVETSAKVPVGARTIPLSIVLEEVVETLLAMIGSMGSDFPDHFDAREVDASLRWYAARITDLQRS